MWMKGLIPASSSDINPNQAVNKTVIESVLTVLVVPGTSLVSSCHIIRYHIRASLKSAVCLYSGYTLN